jgi:hypothetical protein
VKKLWPIKDDAGATLDYGVDAGADDSGIKCKR